MNLALYQLLDNGDSRASGIASRTAMEGGTVSYSENFLNSSAALLAALSFKSHQYKEVWYYSNKFQPWVTET